MSIEPTSQDVPQGIGTAPGHRVETIPPLEETHRGVPVSPRTGEPRRAGALVGLQCLLHGAAAVSGLGYALYWWQAMHVSGFNRSAWIVGWLDPRPGGAGSIALVLTLAVLVIPMVGAPCVAAYQAWTGARSAQRLSLVALVVSLLGLLLNPLACLAIPLCGAGAALVRAQAVTGFFDAWEALRTPPPRSAGPDRAVFYGRLPRFQ